VITKSNISLFFAFAVLSSFSLSIILSIPLFNLNKIQAQQQQQQQQITTIPIEKSNCIKYDSTSRQVFISCPYVSAGPITLTDIYNQLNSPNILNKQQQQNQQIYSIQQQ